MPQLDGLELVSRIRRDYPGLPVVLMTAHGTEEIAMQALRSGAAGYVAKRNLARDLSRTLENVLALIRASSAEQQLMECFSELSSCFVLVNDTTLVPPLVGRLQQQLQRTRMFNENVLLRVSLALREALVNAIEHGNLELSSHLRERDDDSYLQELRRRSDLEPYRSRRVTLAARETRDDVSYVIRDEGPVSTSVPYPIPPTRRTCSRPAVGACCSSALSWTRFPTTPPATRLPWSNGAQLADSPVTTATHPLAVSQPPRPQIGTAIACLFPSATGTIPHSRFLPWSIRRAPMQPWMWIAAGVIALVLLGLIAALIWRPIRRSLREAQLVKARQDFHRQRERLEAKFFELAAGSGKPRGLRWANCDFDDDVAYARDRHSGELAALVAVTISFEAIPGGPMEHVEAVSNCARPRPCFAS